MVIRQRKIAPANDAGRWNTLVHCGHVDIGRWTVRRPAVNPTDRKQPVRGRCKTTRRHVRAISADPARRRRLGRSTPASAERAYGGASKTHTFFRRTRNQHSVRMWIEETNRARLEKPYRGARLIHATALDLE